MKKNVNCLKNRIVSDYKFRRNPKKSSKKEIHLWYLVPLPLFSVQPLNVGTTGQIQLIFAERSAVQCTV